MLSELSNFESYWGPLRLFRYLSFRCVMATVTAFVVSFAIAPLVISYLRGIKSAQVQRGAAEVGKLAELHAWKSGTPIMGGLIIFAGLVLSAILWCGFNSLTAAAMLVYILLTAAGFLDDYQKLIKKNSEGVSAKVKLAFQSAAVLGAFAILYFNPAYKSSLLELWAPFCKTPIIEQMPALFALAFLWLVIAGSSNAVNLTDGLDGLATGCTISVMLVYGIFAYLTGNAIAAEYLHISMVPGAGELAVLCCAALGACMAFLWYNCYPASIWMGDTGSLGIGGLVGAVAFMVHQPITLVLVGGIFVMEAASVIIQVGYYKRTKKRIFRKSPIHHHFEEGGWRETQVVLRFWILSLIFALAGLATLKLR